MELSHSLTWIASEFSKANLKYNGLNNSVLLRKMDEIPLMLHFLLISQNMTLLSIKIMKWANPKLSHNFLRILQYLKTVSEDFQVLLLLLKVTPSFAPSSPVSIFWPQDSGSMMQVEELLRLKVLPAVSFRETPDTDAPGKQESKWLSKELLLKLNWSSNTWMELYLKKTLCIFPTRKSPRRKLTPRFNLPKKLIFLWDVSELRHCLLCHQQHFSSLKLNITFSCVHIKIECIQGFHWSNSVARA